MAEPPGDVPLAALRAGSACLGNDGHRIAALEDDVARPEPAAHARLRRASGEPGPHDREVQQHVAVTVPGLLVGALERVLDVAALVRLRRAAAGDQDRLR